MKKRLAFLLAAALTVTAAFTVAAEEDVTGEWYANLYGMPVTLILDESGEYTMEMEAFEEEGEEPQNGTWELDGESVIMDKGGEDEMSFAYDGETLYADMDGMEMLFSRDPEAAAGFVPAEDEYSEDTEWSARLHEDGMLSLAVTIMDEEFVFYMEPAEETEETEE